MFETDQTNFTIVLPGPCNAKCNFCESVNDPKPTDAYLRKLAAAIREVPKEVRSVSISGGEPSISPNFESTLSYLYSIKRFDRIVLTTNGTQLVKNLHTIGQYVTHLNLSRHFADEERNQKVFQTSAVPSKDVISAAIDILGSENVDVTLNCVYGTEDTLSTRGDAEDLIQFAKEVGAVRVNFRQDQNLNKLNESKLEQSFSEYQTISTTGCPVCLSHHKRIKGLPVSFKYTLAEPGAGLDTIYELIAQPNGDLTVDWEGKRKYSAILKTLDLIDVKVVETPNPTPTQHSGCGYSGCGSPSPNRGYTGSCGGPSTSSC